MIDQTIMSQYANSPRLMAIIETVWEAIDPSKFTKNVFDLIVNIPTANRYGLEIWGRIVGVDQDIAYLNPRYEYFGFGDERQNFDNGTFADAASMAGDWTFTDDNYRELILLKALSNIVYATAPNINALLRAMFGRSAYCLITGHMEMSYIFEFEPTPFQRYLISKAGILPQPCGVFIRNIGYVDRDSVFGFEGSGLQPFNNGVFYNGTT